MATCETHTLPDKQITFDKLDKLSSIFHKYNWTMYKLQYNGLEQTENFTFINNDNYNVMDNFDILVNHGNETNKYKIVYPLKHTSGFSHSLYFNNKEELYNFIEKKLEYLNDD